MEELQGFYNEFGIEPEIKKNEHFILGVWETKHYPEITLEIRDKLETYLRQVCVLEIIIDEDFRYTAKEKYLEDCGCCYGYKTIETSNSNIRNESLCNLLRKLKQAGVIEVEQVKEIVKN